MTEDIFTGPQDWIKTQYIQNTNYFHHQRKKKIYVGLLYNSIFSIIYI